MIPTTLDRLRRALSPGAKPTRKTSARAGGKEQEWFTKRGRDRALLEKYRAIYEQGGLVAEAIDLYPLNMLSLGYTLRGDKDAAAQVQAVFDHIGIEDLWWHQIVDALVLGDGFVENLFGQGRAEDRLVGLAAIPVETMVIDTDEYGTVAGYRQILGLTQRETAKLDPQQVTHLRLLSTTGAAYGLSLVGRAYDEILRDTKTAESVAQAVCRHGFPKYQIAIDPDGTQTPPPTDAEVSEIERAFEDIEAKNEFVTVGPVAVRPLDSGGVQHLQEYSDVTLQRLCAALGVPEELLGLRRGSTDATAVSRIEAFYKKIGTLQQRLAACYNRNVVDQITGRPGAVWVEFNDVSPIDEKVAAEMLATVMTATPMDPFAVVSRRWAQTRLGVDPDEWEKEEGRGE